MSKIRIVALLLAAVTVAVAMPTTKASACPDGYAPCGGVCCPR